MADTILNIDAFNKGIDRLVETLNKLDKSLEKSVKRVSAIDQIFGDSDGLDKFIGSIKNIDKVGARNFSRIADGLSAIARSAKELNEQAVGNVENMLTSLFRVLTAVDKLPGGDAAAKIARTVDRLSQALKRLNELINDSSKSIKPGTALKLAAVYGSIASALKIVSGLLSQLPGGNELDLLSRVFDRVGRAINAFTKVAKISDVKSILQIVKLIGSIALALRVASRIAGNTARLKGFGDALSGLAAFFDKFQRVSVKDPSQFKGFRQGIKEIALGLKELSKINFNPRSLSALSKLPDLKSLSLGGGRGGGSAFDVAGGILLRDAVQGSLRAANRLISGLTSIRRAMSDTLKQIGNQVRNFGQSITSTAQRLLGSFSVERLFQSNATETAAVFDELSSQIKVFGNLTDEQVKKSQEFANQIGIDYPLSANNALEATLSLLKAGQQLGDIEFVLPNAADLAALSESGDVNAAAQSLIAFEGAFDEFANGVEASFENIAVATNIVAAAANSSTASVDNISAGLARVGPAARDAGVTLEETAAALALLDQAQIKGVEGGTALRGVLNSLIRPQSVAELEKLGVQIVNLDGTQRSLNEITTDLSRRYRELGLTQQQVRVSLSKIAEVESRTALSVLVANNGLSRQLELMSEIPPAAQQAAGLMDNFRGDTEQLRGSLETLITKGFIPMINRFFRPFVRFARRVTDFFLSLPDQVIETASTLIFMASAGATLLGGFLLLSGAIATVSGLLIGLVSGIGSVLFSVQGLVAIIGGLSTSLLVTLPLITAFVGLLVGASTIVNTVFSDIEGNVGGAGDAFRKFSIAVNEVVSELFQIGSGIISIFDKLFGATQRTTKQGTLVTQFFTNMTRAAQDFGAVLGDVSSFIDTFNVFLGGTGTRSAFDRYTKLLNDLSRTDLARSLFGQDVTAARLDQFFRQVQTTLVRISNIAKDIGAGIIANLFGVGDPTRLERGVSDALKLVVGLVSNFTGIDFTETLFKLDEGKLNQALGSFIRSIFDQLKLLIVQNKDRLVDAVTFVINFAFNPFNLLEIISGAFGADSLANVFGNLSSSFSAAIKGLIGSVIDVLGGQSIGEAILGNFGDGASGVVAVFGTIQSVIGQVLNFITSSVIPTIQQLGQVIVDLWRMAQPALQQLAGFFLGTALPAVVNFIQSTVIPTVQYFTDVFSQIWEAISPGVSQFINSLQSIEPVIAQVFGRFIDYLPQLVEVSRSVFEAVLEPFLGFVTWLVSDFGPQVIGVFKDVVLPALFDFVSGIVVIVRTIQPAINRIVGFFADVLFPTIQNVVSNLIIPIITLLIDTFRLLWNIATPIITGLASIFVNVLLPPILSVAGFIVDAFNLIIRVVGGFIRAIDAPIRFFAQLISDIFYGIIVPAVNFGVRIFELFGNIVSLIWNVVKLPLEILASIVGTIFNWISENILQPVIGKIGDFIDVLVSIYNIVKKPIEDLGRLVGDIIGGIVQFISDAIDEINRFVNGINDAIDKLEDLNPFDRGGPDQLSEDEVREIFAQTIQLAKEGNREAIEDLRTELKKFLDSGEITEDIYNSVLDSIATTSTDAVRKVAQSADKGSQEIQDFADDTNESLEETIDIAEQLNDILGNPVVPDPVKIKVDDKEVKDFGSDINDLNNQPLDFGIEVDEEGQQDYLDALDERQEREEQRQKEFKDLIKDRKRDRKREEDSIEKLEKAEKKRQDELTKQLQKIDEIQTDFDTEQVEKQAEFNRQTQRNEEDHRQKIDQIIKSADENLQDASISRNAAAAQEAIKNARLQAEEEQRNFELSEQRRLEDFNLQQQQAQAEKDERVREAQERLAEMRQEHIEERAEEAKNHQELLAEIAEREAERLAKEQELTQELIDEQRKASEERAAIEQRESDKRKKALEETTKAVTTLTEGVSNSIKDMFGFIGSSANEVIKQVGSSDPFKQAASIGKSLPPAQVATPKGVPLKTIRISPIPVPSLNTGGDVLRSGLAMLHAGEKVLSQQMIENPYARPQIGSGGDIALQLNLGGVTVNGSNMDTSGLAEEIVNRAEQKIVPQLTRQIRNLREQRRNI